MRGQQLSVTLYIDALLQRRLAVHSSHPVVSSLVFVVDPVEFFIRAVLKAILGDPLLSIAATLSQDTGHNPDIPQVNLQPLSVVLKLGEPRTPAE